MRVNKVGCVLALCLALAGLRHRDAIEQNLFPLANAGLSVNSLAYDTRTAFIAQATRQCLHLAWGQGGFCGCKIERLSGFLTRHEIVTGGFDSVQSYVDNQLGVQKALAQCAREAMTVL